MSILSLYNYNSILCNISSVVLEISKLIWKKNCLRGARKRDTRMSDKATANIDMESGEKDNKMWYVQRNRLRQKKTPEIICNRHQHKGWEEHSKYWNKPVIQLFVVATPLPAVHLDCRLWNKLISACHLSSIWSTN